MKIDFDQIIPRRGTASYKWDSASSDEVLPLWVADMDFMAAPCIIEALRRRVDHGVFGYVRVPDSYYDAIIKWFYRRHGWTIEREWLLYTIGVVPAVSAILQALTVPRQKVLVQTPVYNCFFSSIRNSGCKIVDSPLLYENGTYHVNYLDLEEKLSDPEVKVMLLCNPHNPAGRVWTRDELLRIARLCLDNHVFVISDEIHNEIVMPGYRYTPYGTLGKEYLLNSAICTSPSKSFNIAGLQNANITIADPEIRSLVDRAININEICDVNPFGVEALQAAYSLDGEEWLRQLNEYLYSNYQFLCDYFSKHLPELKVARLEGTYLVWVDCSALRIDSRKLEEDLLQKASVWFNAGDMYSLLPSYFMRINIACPREILRKALVSFARYVESLDLRS